MRSEALPSQNLIFFDFLKVSFFIESKCPHISSRESTKILLPLEIVTGLSVFFLSVRQGVFRYEHSSCIPPESVTTKFACFIKNKKLP